MAFASDIQLIAPTSTVVDDAVGVADAPKSWFVAIVNNRSELSSAERLESLGYETYVASQKEMRLWRNGRRRLIDRIVIPTMVFVRCTERQRLEIVKEPYIFRYLTDRAVAQSGLRRVAVIPDEQIRRLRFMLGHSDEPVEITQERYRKGDRVRVIRGSLAGLEGEVQTAPDGSTHLIIAIDILGTARTKIDPINLERIRD